MSPPPNPGDTSATLVPPGAETTEPSLDGHTDEVASLVPEESESAAEGGDEDEAEAEPKAEADAAVAQEQKKVGEFAHPDSGDTLQTIRDLPTATLADTLLAPNPISVSPELMLELRLRWIEALVLGIGKDGNVVPPREQDMTGTVFKKVNEAQRALDDVVKANEGLRRFMGVYNQNAHLLTPAFAHGLVPPSDMVTVADLEALLVESEVDIRTADRDLREIAELESKGVLDAGKLPNHEPLKPRLEALIQDHLEDLAKFESLEARIAKLIANYSSDVNKLSELFVDWDGALDQAEATLTRLEKEHAQAKETNFD